MLYLARNTKSDRIQFAGIVFMKADNALCDITEKKGLNSTKSPPSGGNFTRVEEKLLQTNSMGEKSIIRLSMGFEHSGMWPVRSGATRSI